jgi:predicted esterase
MVVLAHGWGYSRHVFEPVLQALNQQASTQMPNVLVWDQGYFDENGPGFWQWQTEQTQAAQTQAKPSPNTHQNQHTQPYLWVRQPRPTLRAPCIGIGHSQGLAHLLQGANTVWCRLLSLQGFVCFVRNAHNPHGVAPRLLQHMHAMLQQNPTQVLADFYNRCGDSYTLQHHPARSQPLPAWCTQALSLGLQALHQQDLSQSLHLFLEQGGTLTALLAQDDGLLHPKHACQWPKPSTLHTLPGGHVPWLAHPALYAQYLWQYLQGLDQP